MMRRKKYNYRPLCAGCSSQIPYKQTLCTECELATMEQCRDSHYPQIVRAYHLPLRPLMTLGYMLVRPRPKQYPFAVAEVEDSEFLFDIVSASMGAIRVAALEDIGCIDFVKWDPLCRLDYHHWWTMLNLVRELKPRGVRTQFLFRSDVERANPGVTVWDVYRLPKR